MSSADDDSTPFQLRPDTDFERSYAGQPPWDIDRPQPVFVALAESGRVTGRVLDIGCGTGEHALMAAARGLETVGVDVAPTAIAKAEAKARDRGLSARFLVGDALDLARLAGLAGLDLAGPAEPGDALDRSGLDRSGLGPPRGLFDTVLDCGLFHIFDDEDRPRYAAGLAAVTRPGGRHFLLCFSEHTPGIWGPRRTTQAEIRSSFTEGSGWLVDEITASRLVLTWLPDGVEAWFASLTRL